GCEVTLFASGDSSTMAALVPACPRALRLSRHTIDPAAAHAVLLDALADMANDFDVIHCHLDWIHIPLLHRLGVPFVTTLHGRLDLPSLDSLTRRFASAPFLSISDPQRIPLQTCGRSEEHTSELQSHLNLVCRLLLEKKYLFCICFSIWFNAVSW